MSSLKYSERPVFDWILRLFPHFYHAVIISNPMKFILAPDELYFLFFFKHDFFLILQFYIKMQVTVVALWLAQVSTSNRKSQAWQHNNSNSNSLFLVKMVFGHEWSWLKLDTRRREKTSCDTAETFLQRHGASQPWPHNQHRRPPRRF